jgi:hypothetical protein
VHLTLFKDGEKVSEANAGDVVFWSESIALNVRIQEVN